MVEPRQLNYRRVNLNRPWRPSYQLRNLHRFGKLTCQFVDLANWKQLALVWRTYLEAISPPIFISPRNAIDVIPLHSQHASHAFSAHADREVHAYCELRNLKHLVMWLNYCSRREQNCTFRHGTNWGFFVNGYETSLLSCRIFRDQVNPLWFSAYKIWSTTRCNIRHLYIWSAQYITLSACSSEKKNSDCTDTVSTA
jgi:hypothetical protein